MNNKNYVCLLCFYNQKLLIKYNLTDVSDTTTYTFLALITSGHKSLFTEKNILSKFKPGELTGNKGHYKFNYHTYKKITSIGINIIHTFTAYKFFHTMNTNSEPQKLPLCFTAHSGSRAKST